MSMTATFLMVTAEQFSRLEPTFGEEEEFFEVLNGIRDEAPELPNRHPESRIVDVDQWWHMLHCAIAGDRVMPEQSEAPPPLGKIFSVGTKVQGEEMFAHFLTPDEGMEISQALNALSTEEVRSRVESKTFMNLDLYKIHWCCAEGGADALIDFYEDLVDFFNRAATQQSFVLFQIV